MIKIIRPLILVVSIFIFTVAEAAFTPLSVGLLPPVQFPKDDFTITGLRASILWGRHRDLYGLDLGLLGNITDQDFAGLAVSGGFNVTRGTTTILGLQLAGLTNINTNKTTAAGFQVAGGVNYNSAAAAVNGVQLALLANISPNTDVRGAQIGIYNTANNVYGVQIGVVNVAKSLHGIQIGLVNFNHTGMFAVSPILNVGS